jgi:hypothetical protein
MSRHPTPFSHPAAVKALTRRLFPALGAKRNAQVVGVSVRSVYRWCWELVDAAGRERTAAAAQANAERGDLRRLDRNIALLESLGPDATAAQCLAVALAIEPRRR